MQILLLTLGLMLLSVTGLAVGLFFGRPPIAGSCGGLACKGACETCTRLKEPEA